MSTNTTIRRRTISYLMRQKNIGFLNSPTLSSSTRGILRHNTPRCTLSSPVPKCWKSAESAGFTLENERVLWRRYATIYEREVRYPDGRLVSFDVAQTGSGDSVFVFPFDTRTKSVTLLREYAPGQHALAAGFVAGMYEPEKHKTLEDAARAELSEEALLAGGTLIRLNRDAVQADKYSSNRFHYFLSLDAKQDFQPGNRDMEEFIIIDNVPVGEVRGMIVNGELNTPNSLLGMLALDELRNRGFI